jgi:hypothetical protein
MKSLEWVDSTYVKKHQSEDPTTLRAMYYPNLQLYKPNDGPRGEKKSSPEMVLAFGQRYARRAGISLGVYILTFLPYVGSFVLPAASFYSLNEALGPEPAIGVMMLGFVLPKRWMVALLQGFFASRSLMRELLEPYFSRIRFSKEQKKRWFRDRQGLLFGNTPPPPHRGKERSGTDIVQVSASASTC